MIRFKSLAAAFALMALTGGAATAAQAFYDQYGNVIYVYVAPDGSIIY